MKFATRLIQPSYSRIPVYDSIPDANDVFQFVCEKCGETISKLYSDFIGKAWTWRDEYTAADQKAISEHFQMNVVGKTPDGSAQSIASISCTNCGAKYLIYAGINEYANSAYKVTLQGLSRLANE